ncbi:glycoside hydrolase domain-containing protein [Cellulomonas oligotrophica]|uniref:Peptidoglycan hydrolase-like protein with peptidoglycan-binding domain n=1 Tax=Cellulomonas oligotrophica TaxID=931536 RepID=A0A7Y9FFK3_9CELL|nr:glycoside hydrolase domain-containing protein [Cellulomonas oligotrophica]NYD86280.1 peptidoglycan hydrolase-like protein with peptidoglycan-binding domain [Cellulomonas oligotrophica]
MADAGVRAVQVWFNATYADVPGIPQLAVDGVAGAATIRALTRALQHELGITALSDAFGPSTATRLAAHGDIGPASDARMVALVQAALTCKGYDAGALDGTWSAATAQAARQSATDLGLDRAPDAGVAPKVMKSLLTLDRYLLRPGGRTAVRVVQQWVNRTWFARSLDLLPCDGIPSRALQRALLVAAQYEFGLSDADATGTFGPTTRQRLAEQAPVREGSTDTGARWVQFFTAAMVLNARPVTLGATFTAALTEQVRRFQEFSALPVTGEGDYPTWAQLLVSTGDVTRTVTAADCITEITPARAATLRAAGYRTVGRYLTNAPVPGALDKRLRTGEPAVILDAGLTLFPIYQEDAAGLSSFTEAAGRAQGGRAHDAAWAHRLPPGTTIYFAVDYDAVPADVEGAVVPYFRGVAAALRERGRVYAPGVYGSRDVCTGVSRAVLAPHVFVAGMSTGYTGNAGHPLPGNWAFNQVQTVTLGADGPADAAVEIDRNAASGRDPGVTRVSTEGTVVDPFLAVLDVLQTVAAARLRGARDRGPVAAARLALRYLRSDQGTPFWSTPLAPGDTRFATDADAALAAAGLTRPTTLTDPITFDTLPVARWAAATEAALLLPARWRSPAVKAGDLGGWAGDVVALAGAWWAERADAPDPAPWVVEHLGRTDLVTALDHRTLVADLDGLLLATRVRAGAALPAAARLLALPARQGQAPVAARRYRTALSERFRSRRQTVADAALAALTDPAWKAARAALSPATDWPTALQDRHRPALRTFCGAFADVVVARAQEES